MHTPKTCDDCTLTWDRKHNPKDIVLCPLHRSAPKLLEALKAYITGQEAAEHLSGPANEYDWRGFARDMAEMFCPAIAEAKGN